MKIILEKKLMNAILETIRYYKTMGHTEEEVLLIRASMERLLRNLGYHPMKKSFPLYKIDEES